MRTGSWGRAVTEWMEVTRLQPRRAAAWSNLGFSLLQTGKAAEAVKALEEAVRLAPGEALYRENLAAAREEAARRPAPPRP
jgi:Flp pilus assembly protein TadD